MKTEKQPKKKAGRREIWAEVIKPTLALCVILAVTVGVLAVARHFTREDPGDGTLRYEKSVYTAVYENAEPKKLTYTGKDDRILEVLDAGDGRYLISVISKGYSAKKMEIVVGVSSPDRADGVSFAVFDETQGVGSNIQKDKFLKKYIGEQGPFTAGQNADCAAGATYSSKAFFEALNAAFGAYDEMVKGGAAA